MTQDNEFDWLELKESFWREAAESCQHKPSEQQLRFACLKHSGLNATDSARGAGYAAETDEGMRQQGSRAAKTTAVCELLAYAHAETGKGDSGVVDGKEARRILSRIARKGNNNERIKALEALARIDQNEQASKSIGEVDPVAEIAALVIDLPMSGLGAALGMGVWFETAGSLWSFPFIREAAPIVSKNFSEDWSRWREKHRPEQRPFVDEMAAGPLLEGDYLVHAVKAKRGPVSHKPKVAVGDAT